MQISPFLIYLWQIADSVKHGLGLFSIIGLFAIVFLFMFADLSADEFGETCKRWAKRLPSICIPMGIVAMLIPSSKAIAMMVVIPGIANSSVIQKDLPELYTYAVEALKSQLKEAAK